MPVRPRGRTTTTTVTPAATPPLIRISSTTKGKDTVVVLSIPRWSGPSCALALRIAATAVEQLSGQGWTWHPPTVESGPRGVCTVLTMLVGPPDDLSTYREKAYISELRNAAERETTLSTPHHSLGVMTHRIEVLS